MAPDQTPASLRLPTLIFGTVELHHLQRELETFDEAMTHYSLRSKGPQPVAVIPPRASRLLDALISENHLTVTDAKVRAQLKTSLDTIATSAPVIHMSFATDPSAAVLAKLVGWFRANIDPHALIQVGLQPNIAAGCVVRTTNKVFDLSLRNRFSNNKHILVEALQGGAV